MELNREQIIKALDLHSQAEKPCLRECPYGNLHYCGAEMAKDALALIREVTQAHEMLSESYDHLEKTKDELLSEMARLTEKNEELSTALAKYDHATSVRISEEYVPADVYDEVVAENERLQKVLNTDISIVRVCRGSGKTAHLREVGQIKADAIRADTIRKMAERLEARFDNSNDRIYTGYNIHRFIDQITKEMLEENNGSK